MRLPNVMDEEWFPRRCLRCFFAIQGIDRATVIASQAFTALIPLVILTSALLPTENHASIADAIVRKFALTGDSATAVQTVFAPSGEATIGRAQRAPAPGVRRSASPGASSGCTSRRGSCHAPRACAASLYAAVALGALILELGLLSFIRSLLREIPFDWAAGLTGSLLSSIVVWTSIPWLLLNRRVAWQRLLPAGILAGVLSTVWGYATTVYMPRLMTSYSERYGLFGVTIALVGWLLCISFIIVGDHGRGRRVRPGAGVVGDPAALPVDRVPAAPRPRPRRVAASGVGTTAGGVSDGRRPVTVSLLRTAWPPRT